ncbi:trypsin-1-like [Macrobrachium rosenbergii]|uniref:trypsin-1-like n=1 Tax=Macrobrachium rosenbergii TaxID=79674 RepID=UPI0034D61F75
MDIKIVTASLLDADCGRSTVTVPRIVGGQDASVNEYPWQVHLSILADGFASPATCGASIIKKSWILTAAHCVVDSKTFQVFQNLDVVATFAEYDVNNTAESPSFEIAPRYVFVHPQYKKGPNAQESEDNDIALLYLDATLLFGTSVKPLCMPRPEDYVAEKQVVATGWGTTSYAGQASNTLKEVALYLKSPQNCTILNQNAPTAYIITDNMICALGQNKDACQGDSGGPLITQSDDGRWVQMIVSFGYRCAVPIQFPSLLSPPYPTTTITIIITITITIIITITMPRLQTTFKGSQLPPVLLSLSTQRSSYFKKGWRQEDGTV